MIPLSVLDLAPITEGSTAAQTFANTLDLARAAERLGYKRYWLAEHHNMPGIASAATAVLIGHVAGGTSTIRVGSGGVMLPNHAPLQVAEQFGTLASLYPHRIDLGLGRAPGTDQAAARALRRYYASADEFPADVVELMRFFDPRRSRVKPCARCRAPVSMWKCGFWDRACSARSSPRRSDCRMRSPRTSRRMRSNRRCPFIDARSSRRARLAETACDAGAQCRRRRFRRGSAAAVHDAATGIRQSAPRQAGPGAAAARLRAMRSTTTARRKKRRTSIARSRVPWSVRRETVKRGHRRVRRTAPAGRTHPHRERFRSRLARALVRTGDAGDALALRRQKNV